MNIQELAIIGGKKMPIKIVLINNQGYHSIRQTQANYFPDNSIGCGIDSGLPFPCFASLCSGFSIDYSCATNESDLDSALSSLFRDTSPHLLEVFVDKNQEFSPKIASRRLPDGSMISGTFDDMSPHLASDILETIRNEAHSIRHQ